MTNRQPAHPASPGHPVRSVQYATRAGYRRDQYSAFGSRSQSDFILTWVAACHVPRFHIDEDRVIIPQASVDQAEFSIIFVRDGEVSRIVRVRLSREDAQDPAERYVDPAVFPGVCFRPDDPAGMVLIVVNPGASPRQKGENGPVRPENVQHQLARSSKIELADGIIRRARQHVRAALNEDADQPLPAERRRPRVQKNLAGTRVIVRQRCGKRERVSQHRRLPGTGADVRVRAGAGVAVPAAFQQPRGPLRILFIDKRARRKRVIPGRLIGRLDGPFISLLLAPLLEIVPPLFGAFLDDGSADKTEKMSSVFSSVRNSNSRKCRRDSGAGLTYSSGTRLSDSAPSGVDWAFITISLVSPVVRAYHRTEGSHWIRPCLTPSGVASGQPEG